MNLSLDKKLKKILIIITAITLVLLIISSTVMGVCMVMDAINGTHADDKPNDTDPPDNSEDGPASTLTKPGEKTGIVLPGVTADGTYLSATNDKTLDISEDTDIQSGAVVLTDITSGVVVAGKNADTKIYPASMTKVMTLLVACENAKDPNALLTLTPEMVEKYKLPANKGASLEIVWEVGYQITVEDALHLVIYGSDTYACWLLADYVAGSEEQFVELMNAKAAELGLVGTHFTNCTGLYNAEHYTTCREMAAIMAVTMSNPAAAAVMMKKDQYIVDIYVDGAKTDTAGMWSAWYTGRLEAHPYVSPSGKKAIQYAGNGSDILIIGGKTGYEEIPRNCFVTVGEDDTTGRRYVCVQVGRVDATQEGVTAKMSTGDTREMYWKYAKEDR